MYIYQQGDVQQVRFLIHRKVFAGHARLLLSIFSLDFFPRFSICIKDCDRTSNTSLHYCAENTYPGVAHLLLIYDPGLVNQPDDE